MRTLAVLCLLGLSAVIFSAVNHQVRTRSEKDDALRTLGPGARLVQVGGKRMGAFVQGDGARTVVLINGFGTASPIVDFMPLSDRLARDSRVVTLERFGYGLSDQTDAPRTNENIVNEYRTALRELGIGPPYILMVHSLGGLYAGHWAERHHEEVSAIIGVDETEPIEGFEGGSAPRWTEAVAALGLYRLGYALLPGRTGLDDRIATMNQRGFYSPAELEIMGHAMTWTRGSHAMNNELPAVRTNVIQRMDRPYASDLPVLSLVSQDTVDSTPDWLPAHQRMLGDSPRHQLIVLPGPHYLHYTDLDQIVDRSTAFLRRSGE